MITAEGYECDAVKRYGAQPDPEPSNSAEAGVVINQQVKRLMAEHPDLSYQDAYRRVLDDPDNAAVKRLYSRRG